VSSEKKRSGRDMMVEGILTATGISPRPAFDIEKRPFYATLDGKGKAVTDLFA
jgi:hypothetical protein